MAEEGEVDAVMALFQDFDEAIKKLDEIPTSAQRKTEDLLAFFDAENIFAEGKRGKFQKKLSALTEEVGHAYHTVLAIELARQGLESNIDKDFVSQMLGMGAGNARSNNPQVVVQPSLPPAPQLGVLSGFHYKGAVKELAKAYVKVHGKDDGYNDKPQIATSKEVIDILEFGRQLIPEFNAVQEFYQRSVDHVYFFHDKETLDRLTSEIKKHLSKLAGIIRSFCRTIAEYRKDQQQDRKSDVGKAILALQMAKYEAVGNTSIAEMLQAIRKGSPPTHAEG